MSNRLKILECTPADSGVSGCSCAGEQELIADGWQRRYVADIRSATEAEENYRQLGYEVRLVPPNADSLRAECESCKSVLPNYRIVFTRKR